MQGCADSVTAAQQEQTRPGQTNRCTAQNDGSFSLSLSLSPYLPHSLSLSLSLSIHLSVSLSAQNLLDEVWARETSPKASCMSATNTTLTGCTASYTAVPSVVLFPGGYQLVLPLPTSLRSSDLFVGTFFDTFFSTLPRIGYLGWEMGAGDQSKNPWEEFKQEPKHLA